MPIYEFQCENTRCAHVSERIFRIDEKPQFVDCPLCGHTAKSIISGSADRREWEPYWDENLGHDPVLVQSRAHRRELMRKAGLEDQYHHKPGCKGQWI